MNRLTVLPTEREGDEPCVCLGAVVVVVDLVRIKPECYLR